MTVPTTISFPSSIDDENTFMGDPVDSLSFTLSMGIDGVSGTIPVNEDISAVNVPYLARFQSGEFIYVTGKDTGAGTFTAERGSNGTSATSHDSSEVLRFGLTAPQYSQLIRGIEGIQEVLGANVDTSGSGAGTVAGRISGVENDLSTLQSSLGTVEGDIGAIEGQLGATPEGSFDDVGARFDDAEGRLDDVEVEAVNLFASRGSDLTISSGAITIGDETHYLINGQGSADDDLVTINGGTDGKQNTHS